MAPASVSGRETDAFLAEMDCELAGWHDPAARLARALEQNEFVLYAQPIAALQGAERFPLAEVLIRLREEEKALLPPGEFLPVFEQYGMMPELDRWVASHVIEQLARGSRVPRYSINVSGHTLGEPSFAAYIEARLSEARVPADTLVFEIDETDVLRRAAAAATFAASLQEVGCAVAIDGFGRRAASFAPLKQLKADFLKVDGVLTRKLLLRGGSEPKIRAIVRVAAALGFGVIAECVEEQDILVRLKALGVGYAQGFGIHQPLPIDKLAGR